MGFKFRKCIIDHCLTYCVDFGEFIINRFVCSSNAKRILMHYSLWRHIIKSMLMSKWCFRLRSNVICSFWCEQEVQFFYMVHKISCIMGLEAGLEFQFFLGRESPYQHLKMEGSWNFWKELKKKKNFHYFTACKFIISTSTNIIKFVCYENIYLQN